MSGDFSNCNGNGEEEEEWGEEGDWEWEEEEEEGGEDEQDAKEEGSAPETHLSEVPNGGDLSGESQQPAVNGTLELSASAGNMSDTIFVTYLNENDAEVEVAHEPHMTSVKVTGTAARDLCRFVSRKSPFEKSAGKVAYDKIVVLKEENELNLKVETEIIKNRE